MARWGQTDWREALADKRAVVSGALRQRLPRRLADLLMERAEVPPQRRLSQLSKAERKSLLRQLERCPLAWSGTEGYKTAEVTAGGVPMSEVHLKTLESRALPGVYLCGELLDVTGRLGGYNFLWAWVSGRVAGQAAAQR